MACIILGQLGHHDTSGQLEAGKSIAAACGLSPMLIATLFQGGTGSRSRRKSRSVSTSDRNSFHRTTSPDVTEDPSPPPAVSPAQLSVRCLGGLIVQCRGEVIDLDTLRPRARSLLSLLAISPSRPIHWEILSEALWPGIDAQSASRNVQTAISSVRRVLGDTGPHHAMLKRVGEAYVLSVDESDVAMIEQTFEESEAARSKGDTTTLAVRLWSVLSMYRDHLLPEVGPADWIVNRRDRLRWSVASAAEQLAGLELSRSDFNAAIAAAEWGLWADPLRLSLWNLLTNTLEVTGETARLQQAKEREATVLGA